MCSMKWAATRCGKRRAVAASRPLRRQRSGDDRHPRQFYLATVSQSGWPYIQHRGGPPGFLHLLDDTTLAMADFGGNRQYITTGNLRGSDRACLFLMDYPRRARLKIYATVEVLAAEDHPQLLAQVAPANYRARIERFFFICRRLTGTARSTLRRATARSRWRSTARTCSNVFMTGAGESAPAAAISP